MKKSFLANTDLLIPPIVLGGNVFGWTADAPTSFSILDKMLESGFNFIDTADIYSRWAPGNRGGESETIIGNWLKKGKDREDVIIATKAGMDVGEGISLKKNYLIKAVDKSLKRLQTDYIDLFYAHIDDKNTPVKETLMAFDVLVKAGKIRWIAASKFRPDRLQESLEFSEQNNLPKYQAYQTEYNLYNREEMEGSYEAICTENEVAILPFFALANGFLTGKYRSKNDLHKSQRSDRVEKFLDERGFRILAALDAVAETYNSNPTAVALSWLINHKSIAAPIASVSKLSQADAFIEAAQLQLREVDLKLLTDASSY